MTPPASLTAPPAGRAEPHRLHASVSFSGFLHLSCSTWNMAGSESRTDVRRMPKAPENSVLGPEGSGK